MSINTLDEFNQIYKYNIRQPIGKGGFGEVYKAINTQTHEVVAIKKSEAFEAKGKYTLLNEYEKGVNLRHPNLLKYLDCYRFDTRVGVFDFGVLEYVNGGDLNQFMKNLPSTEQITRVLIGILEGLEYLHGQGIIHRDLKPSNILINYEEGLIVPKIIDFGISKDIKSDASIISNVIGSYEYMSPEQLGAGDQRMKPNSDLWTFGVIVYQMLTGELPFGSRKEGNSSAQIINKVMDAQAPANLSNVPDPFKTLIKICLIKKPEKRVKSAAQCIRLLKNPELISRRKQPKPKRQSMSLGSSSAATRVVSPPQKSVQKPPVARSIPQEIPKASFIMRAIAFSIDSLLYNTIWFVSCLTIVIFFGEYFDQQNPNNLEKKTVEQALIIGTIGGIIPLFLYLIKDWLFRGRGIGKFMLGLRTVSSGTLKPCGFFQSILRNVWMPLLVFSLFIIYGIKDYEILSTSLSILYSSYLLLSIVAVIADTKGRKLSDFISSTRVVENRDLKIRQLI